MSSLFLKVMYLVSLFLALMFPTLGEVTPAVSGGDRKLKVTFEQSGIEIIGTDDSKREI